MMKKSLAHRKMFRNGGAVNAGPAGIMASSPSLIDAVTRDAMNPQGGQTLSMAGGGIVRRMQKGGSATAAWGPGHPLYHGSESALNIPRANTMPDFAGGAMVPSMSPTYERQKRTGGLVPLYLSDKNILRWDPTTARRSGTKPQMAEKMISETLIETGQKVFPESLEPGQADIDVVRKGQPVSNLERGAFSTFGALRDYGQDAVDWLRAAGSKLGEEEIAGDPDAALKALDVGHYEAIQDMTRMYPHHEAFITHEALAAVEKHNIEKKMALERGETPLRDMTPDELKGTVALALEAPQRKVAMETVADTDVATAGIPGAGEGLVTEEEALLQEAPPDDIQDYPPDQGQDDTLGVDDAPLSKATPNAAAVVKEVLGKKSGKGLDYPPDQSQDDTLDEKDAGDMETSINLIKEAARSGDPKETERTLETYYQEFMDIIPKYEGKSNFEKGSDIIKMGMAIAVGESPNTISNVAKGVLATIDNFTDDEKEKRAYERQVRLSAGKYALQNRNKDRTQRAKDLRTRTAMAFTRDFGGHKRGDAFFISDADMISGKFRDMPLGLPTVVAAQIRHDSDAAKLHAKNLKALRDAKLINPKQYAQVQKSQDKHAAALRSVQNKTMMVGMLDQMMGKNATEKLTGMLPYLRDKADSVVNAFGGDSHIKVVEAFKASDLKEYDRQMQFIANRMIKEMLGEGSKNISNVDRDLAEQIVGLLKNRKTIFANPTVLHATMQRVRGEMAKGIESGWTDMAQQEEMWHGLNYQGGGSLAQSLGGARKRGLGGLSVTPAQRGAAPSTRVDLVYTDVIDKSGKLIPGWQKKLRTS